MNKAILIINANTAAAQTIKHNLTSSNTEIVCVSSMHDALQTFIKTEFCLIILDAGISAKDDHKLLKTHAPTSSLTFNLIVKYIVTDLSYVVNGAVNFYKSPKNKTIRQTSPDIS